MAGMGLAWLLGVALQLQERTLLPLWAYLLCLAGGLVGIAVAWRWPRVGLLALLAANFAFAQNSSKNAVCSTKSGAIKGYDPVAYFTDGKPVKGKPDIVFDWHGATWHFATTEHRDLFIGNPDKL